MAEMQIAEIPESYLEYNAQFSAPMFQAWAAPSAIVNELYSGLRHLNVTVGDISWNRDTASLKDLQLTFNIRKLNAIVKFGVETATFIAMNPDWSEAPALVEMFNLVMGKIKEAGVSEVSSQGIALALHVKPGKVPFVDSMERLVNTGMLGKAQMYGISVYNENVSFVIDKSQRYADSVFIRIDRQFGPSESFKEMAESLYADESRVLALLGLQELLA